MEKILRIKLLKVNNVPINLETPDLFKIEKSFLVLINKMIPPIVKELKNKGVHTQIKID